MFQKKIINRDKQKKILELIFQIGYELINDLSDENNLNLTLNQYGENILKKHPQLVELKNNKKEGC